jgi:hypothetical protein
MDELLAQLRMVAIGMHDPDDKSRTGYDWMQDVRQAAYEAENFQRAGRTQDAEQAWLRAGAAAALAAFHVRENAAL